MRAGAATFFGRARFLALAFFLLFVAYSSAQLLQTALNGARGYACLFSVYAAFGLCSLYAPALVARFGANALLPASACGYVIMVGANLFRGESAEWLLIPSCVFVGACAATLWSAQAVYLGQASLELSRSEGRELTLCTSQLNAKFYAVFMSSGVVSGLFSSAVMMSGVPNAVTLLFMLLTGVGAAGVAAFALLPEASDPSARIVALPGTRLAGPALILAADADAAATERAAARWWADDEEAAAAATGDEKLGVDEAAEYSGGGGASAPKAAAASAPQEESSAGGESAAGAPRVHAADAGGGSGASAQGGSSAATAAPVAAPIEPAKAPARPTLVYMIYFLATDRRMRFIIPTIFATGFGAGYVNGAWMGGVVAARIGVPWVGLVGATYSATSSLASTYLWGPLSQRASFGRRWCFAAALTAYVAWYVAFAAFQATTSPGAAPSADFAVLFVGSAAHGLFDPVLSSFVPATLQTFFSSGRDALCAMSSVRVIYSLGFALAQLLSTTLAATGAPRLAEQSALAAGLTLLAAACLSWLHLRVCPIDAATGAQSGAGGDGGAAAAAERA